MFAARVFCVLLATSSLSIAKAPSKPSVSVGIKDTDVGSDLKGLDVNWVGVFNVDEFVLGFKYAITSLRERPESLFVKRTFNAVGGKLTVDTEYNVPRNAFQVIASYANEKFGLAASAIADTADRIKEVSASKSFDSVLGDGDNFTLDAKYETKAGKTTVVSRYARGDAAAVLNFDTEENDPVLTISKNLDENNIVSPSLSFKTGETKYGFTHKFSKGSTVSSKFTPGKDVALTWTDSGDSGVWTSTAVIPLDKSQSTKISIGRDWNF